MVVRESVQLRTLAKHQTSGVSAALQWRRCIMLPLCRSPCKILTIEEPSAARAEVGGLILDIVIRALRVTGYHLELADARGV